MYHNPVPPTRPSFTFLGVVPSSAEFQRPPVGVDGVRLVVKT